MASRSDRRTSLRLDLPHGPPLESPPGIAALFLIRFDIKKGYEIAWKESLPGVELEGVVEYKSLPSGLHNVTEDLVYFVHGQYAGISAFVNRPSVESERNAVMLAVGVLVPLSYGRLGKSWRHAAGLKKLAEHCVDDIANRQPLAEYWERHRVKDDDTQIETPPESPATLRPKPVRDRPDQPHWRQSISEAAGPGGTWPLLAPLHPATSLPELISCFGPLIFPLYRASLLRKRILFMSEAPVHATCDYVYGLALLSTVPQSLLPLLPNEGTPPLRPRPLFNVGVIDISSLSAAAGPDEFSRWIACTTDSVLAHKQGLYDILVTLPPAYSKNAPRKVYPKITLSAPSVSSKPVAIKATQRDARRYTILRDGLRRLPRSNDPEPLDTTDTDTDADVDSDAASTYSTASIVEPVSWPRLAYTSFLWWASAGEKRSGLSEEEEEQDEHDRTLLTGGHDSRPNPSVASSAPHDANIQPQEITLIAYFRRLTTVIFTVLADAVARQDDRDGAADSSIDNNNDAESEENRTDQPITPDEDEAEPANIGEDDNDDRPLLGSRSPSSSSSDNASPVTITADDMTHMGLDVWSAADRAFVQEMLRLWWGRSANVDATRIRCCGIPIL